jgi:type II secretory pathway component GspD/PulD (secretin)
MRYWVLIAVMILVLPAVGAEDEKENAKAGIQIERTEVIQLNYVPVDSVWRVLQPYHAVIRYDSNLQILSVAGAEETVAEIIEVVKKLDVPSASRKNIELVFHILLAGRGDGAGDAEPLPEALSDVAVQLKEVLGVGSVKLIDSSLVRVRDGSGGTTSGVLGGLGPRLANYSVTFKRTVVSGPAGELSVSLYGLRFFARVAPVEQGNFLDIDIGTDIDIKSGQKAVIGRAGVDGEGRQIILVVTARVV